MELMFHAYTNLGDYLSFSLSSIIEQLVYKICNHRKLKDNNPATELKDNKPATYSCCWDEKIPIDIMGIIAGRLQVIDRLRMCAVCKSWRQVIMLHNDILIRAPEIPWLLLPPQGSDCKRLSFYSLFDGRVYNLMSNGGIVCGYSKGWLIIIRGSTVFLLNPVSGAEIRLPSLRTIPCFEEFTLLHLGHYAFVYRIMGNYALVNWFMGHYVADFVYRVEVSSSPDSADCIVAAIFNGEVLAFCKPGDKEWSIFDYEEEEEDYEILFDDILFYDQSLYTLINKYGDESVATHTVVLADNVLTLKLIPRHVGDRDEDLELWDRHVIGPDMGFSKNIVADSYFVESIHGELLKIHHIMDHYAMQEQEDLHIRHIYPQTNGFKIFKVNPITGHLDRLSSLGEDQVLFLATGGGSSSLRVNNINGYKGNCIYFAAAAFQQFREYPLYMSRESGVFYLEDGRIERSFPTIKLPIESRMCWFTPCVQ